MNLKLKSIADKGNFEKERLVIGVVNDTDVGEYLLMRTGLTDGKPNIEVANTFWFPDKEVKAGDLVVLYSKDGTNKEKPTERGRTVHFYYWGLIAAAWSGVDHAAVLAHAPVWESSSTEEL